MATPAALLPMASVVRMCDYAAFNAACMRYARAAFGWDSPECVGDSGSVWQPASS